MRTSQKHGFFSSLSRFRSNNNSKEDNGKKNDQIVADSSNNGHEPIVSDKIIQQAQMAYMRKELEKNKFDLNITYPIDPPYAFAHIIYDKTRGEFNYIIKEPEITVEEQKTLANIKDKLEATLDQEDLPIDETFSFSKSNLLEEYIHNRFKSIIELYDIKLSDKRKPFLFYHLKKDLLGMGRADSILKDTFVEDIGCNGPNIPLYIYHRVFGSMKTNILYPRELELNKFILKLAQISGKHISVYDPILDTVLHDGSRINLTLGNEVTKKGGTFTIRKFSYDPISPIDLMRFGSVNSEIMAYYWFLIEHKKSILMSGGTASGKTTMLNALCMFIKPEDKIVSIEDTPEIHIDHENWIQSVSRKGYGKASGISGLSGMSGISGISGIGTSGSVDMFDLLVTALRQRPEYILVGEIRGQEAFTLFQAIAVGHACMSTVHAGNISELLHRVENQPMNIPRVLFQSVDVVGFIGQVFTTGKRVRRVKNIIEVLELEPETDNLITNQVFNWNPKIDEFHYQGRSFVLEKIGTEIGKEIKEITEEFKRKQYYLELMDKKNITYYKQVSKAIAHYYMDPETAIRDLERSEAA